MLCIHCFGILSIVLRVLDFSGLSLGLGAQSSLGFEDTVQGLGVWDARFR